MSDPTVKPKGFAALSQDERRLIASAGGKAAHAAGTAHRYTSEEARAASKLALRARLLRKTGVKPAI